MLVANILVTLLFATATGCPPDSGTATRPAAEVQPAAAGKLVQLTGFVELYRDGDVLLSDGREITLAGPAHLLEPMGGLEAQLTGRFIDRDVFLVETVGPVAQRVIARTAGGAAATARPEDPKRR